ncbi:hypothetical protein FHR81_001198 [Actinoalloteichus hoggarensis]|uniref:Uncharacterized protein n=1 Tax=Actinoalloteichus hoggarensis TaxID=1470176 RepID=A0A221VZI5_9PSEU|nr:hypothetical protein AHOG_06400 [Actinoalloteichus hoggarensis]MBB5920168.1 hypothetical protein [Actinoalloteichus hoggarensis]
MSLEQPQNVSSPHGQSVPRRCPACHKFGKFAPGHARCLRCLGWLPLDFGPAVNTLGRGGRDA